MYFTQEKNEKDGLQQQYENSCSGSGRPAAGGRHEMDDGNLGLFSQYVKRQGFAYYRDLAGKTVQCSDNHYLSLK